MIKTNKKIRKRESYAKKTIPPNKKLRKGGIE